MGSLVSLIFLPLVAPVRGFRFVLEQLRDEADAVLRDEGRAYAELVDLSMRRSAGQLSDAEYTEAETALLERLSAIRDYRNELSRAELDMEDEYEEDDEEEFDEEYWLFDDITEEQVVALQTYEEET